jgi:hypothetical protein|tara:strand:- start:8591 stop:9505 length:915 start_codon:yes stop_codon:yes gene_type:complete
MENPMQEELELDTEETNDEIEVITEETEEQSEPETQESDQEPDQAPVKKEGDDEDEIENYSESVQRRIRKLTAKYREEERQRQAAIDYAEAVKKQNDDLQKKLRTREESYVGEFGSRVEHEAEAAKEAYKRAHEEGDVDAMYDAQQRISKIALEKARYEEAQARFERDKEQQVATPVEQPVQEPAPTPDPKAQEWAEKNTWFGEDQSMTYAAFGIHRQLVEEEGFDPTADEYYTELDKRIRSDFPNRFQDTARKSGKPRVASAESTASRSSNKGRRTVKLTESQVAIAKRLGVPLEEYAKYVKD